MSELTKKGYVLNRIAQDMAARGRKYKKQDRADIRSARLSSAVDEFLANDGEIQKLDVSSDRKESFRTVS